MSIYFLYYDLRFRNMERSRFEAGMMCQIFPPAWPYGECPWFAFARGTATAWSGLHLSKSGGAFSPGGCRQLLFASKLWGFTSRVDLMRPRPSPCSPC